MVSKSFLINNKKISYSTTGKGEPLILIHGYRSDSTVWRELVQLLKPRFSLIIPDLPGHGKSQIVWEVNHMDLLSKVIHRLYLELNLESASIVGHSMGGYVALAFAKDSPDLIKDLYLINSLPFADNLDRKKTRLKELKLIEDGKRDVLIKSFASNGFSRGFVKNHLDIVKDFIDHILKLPAVGDVADLIGMMNRKDCYNTAKKLSQKICFVFGSEDPSTPAAICQQLASEFKTFIVKGCGHMTIIENPQEIAQILVAHY